MTKELNKNNKIEADNTLIVDLEATDANEGAVGLRQDVSNPSKKSLKVVNTKV